MRKYFILALLLSLLCGAHAFTGFNVSNTFAIDVSTLPVELSSFTAVASGQSNVTISWITQSETNLLGFYVYRNEVNEQASAICVSPIFSANNSSTLQNYAYLDSEVSEGLWYYWLESVEINGTSNLHGPVYATVSHDDQQETPEIPLITGIRSVFPNPFNPSTTITIGLSKASTVQMKIYNLKGELVRDLDASSKAAGTHHVVWNGISDSGQACASGIYLLKLTANGKSTQARLTLMK